MKSFLKWAGGKYSIIETIKENLPKGKRLVEPFVGSGAVFLNTDYEAYLLADANKDLIDLFNTVKKEGIYFIDYASYYFDASFNNEESFYEFRKEFNETLDMRKKSALFIYLNRHCFNGLCRYNKKGGFNVPFGRYKQPIFPRELLINFYHKSQSAVFIHASFEETFNLIQNDDVVYCDPPYVPLSASSSFTSYTVDGFNENHQKKLAELSELTNKKGNYVMISNHDNEFTRLIYANAKIKNFDVQRFISSKTTQRNKAPELLAIYL